MPDARGFITLEIMMAVAFMGTALAAAIAIDRGSAYWIMSAHASRDDLQAAAAAIEAVTAQASDEFVDVVSAPAQDGPECPSSDGCDGVRITVTDVSTCAKNVEASVERHLPGYPTRRTSLTSILTDPAEFGALGGDCALSVPAGNWRVPMVAASTDLGGGNPTGIDVFEGVAYLSFDAPPYLRIVTPQGAVTFSNEYVGAGPFNAIDVARDETTGRTYAFVAAVTPQLQIIDVTDPQAPEPIGSSSLAGVTLTGAQAQAWRIAVYGSMAYVAARYMIAANPELHLFDISDPARPREMNGGYKISTSTYGMIVRGQGARGTADARRLLYLATTAPAAELKVLDVSDPERIATVASCDLPGSYQANALALLGTTLYVGRDNVPSGGEDLFAFDAADPTAPSFCTPVGKTDIGTDGYSRHVQAIRASGPYLFVATSNTTNAHGEVQVRSSDPAGNMSLFGTFAMPALAENALDVDNDILYAAGTANPQLQAITAP